MDFEQVCTKYFIKELDFNEEESIKVVEHMQYVLSNVDLLKGVKFEEKRWDKDLVNLNYNYLILIFNFTHYPKLRTLKTLGYLSFKSIEFIDILFGKRYLLPIANLLATVGDLGTEKFVEEYSKF